MVHLLQILILAIIQGATEMLPVSSSAHVTIASQLMHFNRGSDYDWAFLLIMLHTGNMLAVLLYFRSQWKSLWKQWPALLVATAATLVVGGILYLVIKRFFLAPGEDIESLFNQLPLIAIALAAVGAMILISGLKDRKSPGKTATIANVPAALIGIIQGIALPFRGFSRSGSTISTGLFCDIERGRSEEFSFALAVLITPAIIVFEARHLVHHPIASAGTGATPMDFSTLLVSSLAGMVFSFFAGLAGLWLLSRWLERGHWLCFGVYCLIAAAVVLAIHYGIR